MSAVNAYSKPAPPPTASGHFKARAHGHGRIHGHGRPASQGENGDRPVNDVKVDADDGGEPQGGHGDVAPQNAAPEHGPARGHGRSRPARPARNKPAASRPGTGADSGFADADDLALPPEAAQAIQEANELQKAGGGSGNGAQQGAPEAPAGAPGAPGAAPAAPARPGGPARPQSPVSDQSTNQTSGRQAARPHSAPVSFFNGIPAQSSRLVLHTTTGGSPERTVTLQCYPTGGTHPKAAQACADVARAGGDLAQMPSSANPRACFMIYSPVTVTAQGKWQGQNVRYTKKFPNTCVMHDKTGSVFDF